MVGVTNIDVEKVIKFQNSLTKFIKKVKNSVNYHLEFWRELNLKIPHIPKLLNLGS